MVFSPYEFKFVPAGSISQKQRRLSGKPNLGKTPLPLKIYIFLKKREKRPLVFTKRRHCLCTYIFYNNRAGLSRGNLSFVRKKSGFSGRQDLGDMTGPECVN